MAPAFGVGSWACQALHTVHRPAPGWGLRMGIDLVADQTEAFVEEDNTVRLALCAIIIVLCLGVIASLMVVSVLYPTYAASSLD